MIRRLFIYGVPLCLALLVWTQAVKAQGCYPGNNPTVGISTFNILSPADYAAQGGSTVTITQELGGTGLKNKKATAGVGTNVTYLWSSNNVASVSSYYTLDGGSQRYNYSINTLSGSSNSTFGDQSWIGHYLTLYVVGYDSRGNVLSTDRLTQTFTGDPPGDIIYEDGNDSNIIVLISSAYSGVPQISFADCPSMRTAHHTPTATLQLQNTSSGEVHNAVSTAGPAVLAGNSVQASSTDAISALVGDTISGSYGGITFCDVDNINFFGLQSLFRIEGAKVVVADLGHPPRVGSEKPVPSAIYDVAPICQNNCDPPDWQPTVVHSWAGRHPYWIGECQLLRAPDVNGVPWIPLCSFLTDASGAFGAGLVPSTIQLAAGGLALPYPGPAPLLPIPGKCTKYPVNVLFTVGPNDLKNWFENIPN